MMTSRVYVSRRLATAFLAAAGFLVLTACASSPPGPSGGDACVSDLPPHGRSLTSLMDSAGARADLEASWSHLSDLTLAAIDLDSLLTPRARVYSASLTEESKDRLGETLVGHLRTFGPTDTLRLVVAGESAPGPRRVRRFAACPPRLTNVREVQRALYRNAARLVQEEPQTVGVWAHVGADGRVLDTRVERSSSRVEVDRAAVESIRIAQFTPARLENIPVAVWVSLPLTVALRTRPVPEPEPDPFR